MFTVPAPLIGFVMLTLAALAPPVSTTLSPPTFEHPNMLQRLLLTFSVLPPPVNDTRPPLTLRLELPVTLASGPLSRLRVLPFASRARSPVTKRLLPLRRFT